MDRIEKRKNRFYIYGGDPWNVDVFTQHSQC